MSTDTQPEQPRAGQPILKALARHIAGYVGGGMNPEAVAAGFIVAGFEELKKHNSHDFSVVLAKQLIDLHAKGENP